MPRATFIAEPQRSDGKGYIPCELHRATSFAVVKVQSFQLRSKRYTTRAVLSRHTNLNQANFEAHAQTLGTLGPKRQYKLGNRMQEREKING